MYTLKCEYTPYIESGENGAYKENPWLFITDKQDDSGWGGNWSFAIFDYEIGAEFMNGTLSEKLSAVHSFRLKIYYDSIPDSDEKRAPLNPNYPDQSLIAIDRDFHWNNIDAYRTSCSLYRGDKLIFEGRFSSVEEYMDADGKIYKVVTCESRLAYLSDTVVDANEIRRWFKELGYEKYTPKNLAYAIVKAYNQTTGGYAGHMNKTFGYDNNGTWVMNSNHVNVSGFGSDDYEYILDSNSPDTPLNWLKKIFVDELGGCMWISHNSGKTKTDAGYLRLNIAQNYPKKTSNQKITLGSNMKSLVIRNAYNESGNITQYVPYGGVGADGRRLMLDHVTQKIYGGTGEITKREVENGALFNSYGTIQEPLIYDDLVDDGQKTFDEIISMENAMLRRAQVQAKQLDDRITSIEVSAYDLYYAGYNVSEFEVGATYYIENSLLNFSGYFQLLEREIDLAAPWGGRLTFGSGLRKMSGQTASRFSTIDKRIHNVERTLSTRLDGGSLKLKGSGGALTQAEFDSLLTQHKADPDKLLIRDDVFYFPEQDDGETVHAYKGTKRIELGGGGGRVEYATVVFGERLLYWTLVPNEKLMPVYFRGECAAYYGGAPARMIINGYRVLFNVEYEDILPKDISGDVVFPTQDGTGTMGLTSYISAQTATTLTIRVAVTSNGELTDTYYNFVLNTTKVNLEKLSFGVVLDYTTIEKSSATEFKNYGYYGKTGSAKTKKWGSTTTNIACAAFEENELLEFTSCSRNGTNPLTYLYIFREREWHFDMGLAKRSEVEKT